ncbi:hypothetical protein EUGRSUZ_H04874 [Eucalyptus grandis]|uniref:Uncharacterized protein n=2 Tax=Eucalyptus grandis TaxID=71139 RepID=A0ACC3JYF0_EUCGR|nr:hypothetical protein EUGRSUZ_H04874 [Eucalyptus grandis]
MPSICALLFPHAGSARLKNIAFAEVVHKHGPCSPHGQAKPNALNHTKTLARDQSRVALIRSNFSMSSSNNPTKGGSLGGSKATILATLFDSVEYVVTIGIGSTQSRLTLAFDTGSDLTWIQCEPCLSCHHQSKPIFNPSHFSSYTNVLCTSPLCKGISTSCSGSTCNYQITYGNQSSSSTNLTTDTLTLTFTYVIRNFQFSCGRFNYGLFDKEAGLLGLARDGLSIVGQTASKYGRYISYCLPSSSISTGYLILGKTTPNSLTLTALATIQEIGTTLQILSTVFSKAEAIIDSGTVITRLPPMVYNAMRTAFQREMAGYDMAKSFNIFDTCYDLHNNNTNIVIYGNMRQKTFEVIYDDARGQLGFAPSGCL